MNFFTIPIFSFIPQKYKDLIKESGGRIFGSLLICFLILGLISGLRASSVISSITNEIQSSWSDFSLESGKFNIDKPFTYDEDGSYVNIDSSIDSVTAAQIEDISKSGAYSNILIVGQNGLGMSQDGRIQTFDFESIKDFSLSKNSLCNSILPMLKVGIIIGCLVGAFLSIGFYYLVALVLQFFTNIVAKNGFHFEFAETERFRFTVLAKFPAHLIVYVLKALGLSVGIFFNLLLQIVIIVLFLYFYNKDTEQDSTIDVITMQ